MLADFKNSFAVVLSNKFTTRFMSYVSPHLKRVTTLPCETRKLNNSNALDVFNTIS